jgi:hypothetical protein
MKAESPAPDLDLSVILFTLYPVAVLTPVLSALRAQTVRDRIELIVAVRSRRVFGATEADLSGFGAAKVVEAGESARLAEGKIVAIRSASSPIVVFAEDHCFPEPDWAERLIAAHGGSVAGAGPVIRNPNPRTLLSWAAFYLHWGPWTEPCQNPESAGLPPHNGSYRRSVLRELDGRLRELLIAEQFLQAVMVRMGHELRVEPRAVVSHCNVSRLVPWIGLGYWGGRLYGAMRARHEEWSPLDRALRASMSPAVPLVRLKRAMADVIRTGRAEELLPQLIPVVLFGLVIHAVGEAIGYIAGVGKAEDRYFTFEVSRLSHLADGELDAINARWSVIPSAAEKVA